jgi:uncharacterized protein DUF1707
LEVPVMTGPDEGTRSGRGHLRAAQADREQAVTVLKTAYAQGRLTKDELEARVGQAFGSRTYAELAALTADIPADSPADAGAAAAGPAGAGSPRSTPSRTMAKAAGRSGICLLAAVALAEASFLADNFLLIVAAFFALMAASGFFGYGILDAWHERRARGQLPPGPGPGPGPGQGHRGSGGRRPGEDATPAGFSPARIDGSRVDRTRADGTRADSRTRRPARGRRHPSGRGFPVPVRPRPTAAWGAG